jgi:hypothetical protein
METAHQSTLRHILKDSNLNQWTLWSPQITRVQMLPDVRCKVHSQWFIRLAPSGFQPNAMFNLTLTPRGSSSWTALPWRWRYYDTSKRRQPFPKDKASHPKRIQSYIPKSLWIFFYRYRGIISHSHTYSRARNTSQYVSCKTFRLDIMTLPLFKYLITLSAYLESFFYPLLLLSIYVSCNPLLHRT